MLVLGGFFFIVFAVVEKSIAKIPLIPLRLFGHRSTAILYVQSALYDCVWQVNLYFLPIYFQEVRGYTPLQSATLVLPLLLAHSTAGVISGPIMSKFARCVMMLEVSCSQRALMLFKDSHQYFSSAWRCGLWDPD